MQDLEKNNKVIELCNEIIRLSNLYATDKDKIYFDYDRVIEQLEKAKNVIDQTVRCPRPEGIPKDIPWSEKMFTDADEEFNPYLFDNSMSIEDFEKVQESFLKEKNNDREGKNTEERKDFCEECKTDTIFQVTKVEEENGDLSIYECCSNCGYEVDNIIKSYNRK